MSDASTSVLLLAILYDIHIYSYNNYIIIWLAKTDNSNKLWLDRRKVQSSKRVDTMWWCVLSASATNNNSKHHTRPQACWSWRWLHNQPGGAVTTQTETDKRWNRSLLLSSWLFFQPWLQHFSCLPLLLWCKEVEQALPSKWHGLRKTAMKSSWLPLPSYPQTLLGRCVCIFTSFPLFLVFIST